MNEKQFEIWKNGMLRRILLFAVLALLVLWALSKEKFTFRLTPPASSTTQTTQQRIGAQPEVLSLQESFAQVAEVVKPAVVNITTVHIEKYQEFPYEFFFWNPDELFEQFFNLPSQPRSRKAPPFEKKFHQKKIPGTGSGVIIDQEGYILTNEHVVRGADEIKVTLADDSDKKLDGKVIGRDERTDLAVIKIKSSKKLPYARLGNSETLRVGDWAIAIGSPFGLEQTLTVGVISAARQNLSIEGRNYKDLIQTDAAINPGNSGGPLVNIRGEVIGINTAIFTPSGGFAGVGFAIPIDRAKEIIPQLREKGKVVRGWIGVMLEEKIDEATAAVFGVSDKQGAMVKKVLPDYPAAKAGLKRGDIVREFSGKKIKDNSDLQTVVSATAPNKKVPVKIIRNKHEMVLELTTSEAPASLESLREGIESEPSVPDEAKEPTATWLGMTVKECTPTLRQQFNIPETEKGIAIVEVEPDSKSQEIGFMVGDLLRAINQELIADLKTFNDTAKKIKTSSGLVCDILRRGEPIYLSYMGPEK